MIGLGLSFWQTRGQSEIAFDFDRVAYDHAVDGAATEIVIPVGTNAGRVQIFVRDITFASSSRLVGYLSEDEGATVDTAHVGNFEYSYIEWTGGTGRDGSIQASGTAITTGLNSTGPHDACIEIIGMNSGALRTSIEAMGGNGARVRLIDLARSIARKENAVVFRTEGGQSITGGQVVVRTYTEELDVALAINSMWVGNVT